MAKAQRKRKAPISRSSSVKPRKPRKSAVRGSSGAKTRKKPVKRKSSSASNQEYGKECTSVLLGFLGCLLGAALLSYARGGVGADNILGLVGSKVSTTLFEWFGWCSFITVVWAFLFAVAIWRSIEDDSVEAGNRITITFLSTLLMTCGLASFAALAFDLSAGGRLGVKIALFLSPMLSDAGTMLVSFVVFIFSLSLAARLRLESVFEKLNIFCTWFGEILADILYFSQRTLVFLFKSVFSSFSFIVGGFRNGFEKERPDSFSLPLPSRSKKELEPKLSGPRIVKGTGSERVRKSAGFGHYTLGDEDDPLISEELLVSDPEIDLSSEPFEAGEEGFSPAAGPIDIKISRGNRSEEKNSKPGGLFSRLKRNSEPKDEEVEYEERDYGDYELPGTDILVRGETNEIGAPKDKELLVNSKLLEKALLDFNIGGNIVEVHPGPVITLYQFNPAAGVKVQKIINLSDDIALALKVARVRVYAPVPGKGTVGIEVPNAQRQIVRLRDILESDEIWNPDVPLELALGKDTFGQPVVADLAKMPHLLIAGATGTGKSVCINSILMSLLYRNSPEDLRLLLIDPKMLELTVYERVPHLKAPVVTNPKHARGLLWWAVEEMERRYKLMMKLGVRGIDSYNKAVSSSAAVSKRISKRAQSDIIELEEQNIVATAAEDGVDRSKASRLNSDASTETRSDGEELPRIVIVVDELADLMLTVGKDIEELLTRLAQKARAAGIHLILATQRPSVNVITGLIKANFPSRISFQVASKVDSRTVIDTSGAEKLLGQGDMLFLPPGTGRLRRLHSPFVSDSEVSDVIAYIRSQGDPDYDPEVSKVIESMNQKGSGIDGFGSGGESEFDPLYDQAVQLVIEKGQASTSMVQRAFRIGYNRAARILDSMESEGVVGPADGARPRQIIVPNHSG